MKKLIVTTAILPFLIIFNSCKPDQERAVTDEPGEIASEFTLDSLTGNQKVSLSDLRGNGVVLNFWATWCGPCREEMPLFESAWQKYRDKNIVFLGIDVQDDRGNARKFLEKSGITYQNLYDPSGTVSGKYGVIALPATFFIDKNGNITAKNYGSFAGSEGEALLEGYLKELAQ